MVTGRKDKWDCPQEKGKPRSQNIPQKSPPHDNNREKDYKQIKKQSNRQDIWVAQMITAQAEARNTTKTKLWKCLRQMEQSQNTAQKVKKALGKSITHNGLNQVTAPTSQTDSTRLTLTTKIELENACLEEARCRFTQAANTPMLQTPMIDLLGMDNMESKTFHQILQGTFECPPGCNQYLWKLLPFLARPAHLPDISMCTYNEYKKSWEQARETTASSSLSLHFGHYIAGVANDIVGKLNAIMANAWLVDGTAPSQWTKTLNVMLEKVAGNDNVEKL